MHRVSESLTTADATAPASTEAGAGSALPPLMADAAFHAMTATQFLGAFNDNLFKQLMLLLAIPVGASAASQQDQQGLATVVFSLPFVLFSGYAGFLSDRYSKRRIIVLSKVAEILVMSLGVVAFLAYSWSGYAGLLCVLFLMGMQSSFFGPGKYGILPEMLRDSDLPRANGIILMTTFLAIIFGIASAGALGNLFIEPDAPLVQSAGRVWIGSAVCILIAIAGTLTSLLIRRVPPSLPNLRFRLSALIIPPEARQTLLTDRPLLGALLASCMFWLICGVATQAVNSLGMVQLDVGILYTSVMTAIVGLGIAGGAVIAGRLCHGRADFRLVRLGIWGIAIFLVLLSISLPGGRHLLGYYGTLPVLVLLGVAAAFFAIPIQVFIQARPPDGQKGRIVAVMNQLNFVAILLSGVLYSIFDRIVVWMQWPRSPIFVMMAMLVIPLLLYYHPERYANESRHDNASV